MAAAPDDYEQARILFEHKDFERALHILERLYERDHDPWLLQKQAQCYENMQRFEAALRVYRQILAQPTADADLLSLAKLSEGRIETMLAQPVEVTVVATAPGAELRIGDTTGPSPLVATLPRGRHEVEARAPGFRKAHQTFSLESPGQVVQVDLLPIVVSVVLRLRDASPTDVKVLLDGRNAEPRPDDATPGALEVRVPPGDHVLRCLRVDGAERSTLLRVPHDADLVRATCDFTPEPSALPAWLTLGAGLATTATGLGLAIDARILEGEASGSAAKQCQSCTEQEIAGWVLAGVGAAASVTSIFLFPSDREGASDDGPVRVSGGAFAGPDGAGAVMTWSF